MASACPIDYHAAATLRPGSPLCGIFSWAVATPQRSTCTGFDHDRVFGERLPRFGGAWKMLLQRQRIPIRLGSVFVSRYGRPASVSKRSRSSATLLRSRSPRVRLHCLAWHVVVTTKADQPMRRVDAENG
jgi:hypothetical protein